MSSKYIIYMIFLFGHMSIWNGCNGDSYYIGSSPNVTGLTPNVSIFRTTYLYGSPINISLTVYQRPVNNTLKQTLRVIDGNTNVNSADRCIGYGVSFRLWGPYPIMNTTTTRNGGCDAILGSQCTQNILNSLIKSFNDINKIACGVNIDFLFHSIQGCPKNTTNSELISSTFLNNGSFMLNESSASNSLTPWIYTSNNPSINGDYDNLMKYFAFVYFVGRPYSSGFIESAIACLSIYNTTVESNNKDTITSPNNIAIQLPLFGNIIIFASLFIIFFNTIS